jgi:hypothetical protein
MNPKFRPLYLIAGAIGLISLIYYAITNTSNMDPAAVLAISLPDMVFFYLAYKTYPEEPVSNRFSEYR